MGSPSGEILPPDSAGAFMPHRPRALLVLGLLLAAALAAILVALATGELKASPGDVLAALHLGEGGGVAAIVRELRLPRAVAAFTCGGLLALAGALMQVLLRNPLADP